MPKEIKKIGVLGAGTMGTGIAAQAANAGIEVVLLDKFEGKADKEIQRMLKAKPTDAFNAGFMTPENAKNITTGTTDDNLDLLADCDWIIESILVPNPQIRQDLYKEVQKVAKPDAIFSSNTSMDTTSDITYDQDADFKGRFLNTHFFNPVRFMHLLEIIPSEETDPEMVKLVADFGDKVLGKKIVECKDERGFIANRIGIYAMERAHAEALNQNMKIEDVDALMGKAFGFPHLGMFKLADEVGLDVVDHVRSDFAEHLPQTDDFQQNFTGHDQLRGMIANGYVGNRKDDSLGGYYRVKKDENGRVMKGEDGKPLKEALDLQTGEYRDFEQSPHSRFEKQIKKFGGYDKFFDSDHSGADFAWPVLRDVMLYVLEHADELAHDVQSVDDAMRAGFNWDYGPFQLLDKFGVDWFISKLDEEGTAVPLLLQKADKSFYRKKDGELQVMDLDGKYNKIKREEGTLHLDDIKAASEPLVTHHSASLWDIGDGITCLEFHSTQNSIDPSILHVINESIKLINDSEGKYKGMVVYNDADRFSVGANLKLAEVFMNVADGKIGELTDNKKLNKAIETAFRSTVSMTGMSKKAEEGLKHILHELIYQGQAVYTALNQAPFPVIGAPRGQLPKSAREANLALGGGNEILMNCDAVQSGPEQAMGLPEIAVGILPAWTGSTRYLERATEKSQKSGNAKGPMAPVVESATILADPANGIGINAQDAKKKLWLGENDGISMNPDRVLADAKQKALDMAPDYKPKPLPSFNLPGPAGRAAIRMNVDKMYLKADNPKIGVNQTDVKAADRLATVLTGGETLTKDDIPHHTDTNQEALAALIDKKDKDHLTINPTVTLNYSRMMQLERDYILDAFNDKANTWPRLRHMLATNNPLREERLDPAPAPNDLRAEMEHSDLPRRDIDGQPLSGDDGDRLKAMASMTREFYKQMSAKGATGTLAQGKRTLAAVRRALSLFP